MKKGTWGIILFVHIEMKCEFRATGFGQEVGHVKNDTGEISDFLVIAIENEHTLWTLRTSSCKYKGDMNIYMRVL